MDLGQIILPYGVDIDIDPTLIKSEKAFFLKGIETDWVINGGQGQNAKKLKPAESNYLYCSINLPEGVNMLIGYHYHSESNEGYCIVHNSNGNHLIYRIRGIDQTAEVVYRFCKNFEGITNNPKDFFNEGRIAIKSFCKIKSNGDKELVKFLYLVNSKIENLQIVVEDSIQTNSFTTPFFTSKNICCGDPCRIVKSGVPTPMGKIKVVPIQVTDTDKFKQNTMLFKMFKFRVVDENAWGQRSEHGIISDPYFNNLAGCSRDAAGQPHCVWLEMLTPCPDIVKRTVEVQTCELSNTIGTDGNIFSTWKEAFTINLYDQANKDLKWYERKYDTSNKEFEFFNDGSKMRIKFCNNRECKQIALADLRNSNPAPIRSGSVASVGKELVYGNNENDLEPMSKEAIESIKLDILPTDACEQKFSNVKVYMVVHNYMENQNNPIHKRSTKTVFGGFGKDPFIGNTRFEENVGDPETSLTTDGGHGQYFPEGVVGFRARLAGTNYTAESVQYLYTNAGIEKIGVLDGDKDGLDAIKKFVSNVKPGKQWAIQEFDFGMVACGTYFFEINSHTDNNNGIPFDKTSTYYIHTTTVNNYHQSFGITQNYQKRIFINTSDGSDFDSLKSGELAVVADLTNPENGQSPGNYVIRGYVYESKNNNIPIEMADVRASANALSVTSMFTDHYGFYFISAFSKVRFKGQIFGVRKCAFNYLIGQTSEKKAEGTTLVSTIFVSERLLDYEKELCNRYFITGKITECGTTAGVEGIAIVQERTAPVYTNSKGEFKVISHFGNGRGAEKLIFSLGGSCYVLDCNCQPINVVINTVQPSCTDCSENTSSIGNFSLKTIVTKGFPHGSRIQVGMIGHDWLGRQTYIQTSEKLFVDFPTEQEQGNARYSRLQVTLPDKFPDDICKKYSRITFAFSKNTNYEDFFTWAADQVEFVDSAGNKNESSPSKIRIWWRSLNEYNKIRGFNTNTTWSFLNAQMDTNGNASLGEDGNPIFNSKLGDTVEFIKNVDGVYFAPNTIGNVQYDKAGTYFVVDYDDSLKSLKDGVYFKIKRPYICETNKTFYEFSFPINFCSGNCTPKDDDGNVVKTFLLDGFSSYTLPRQIPVVTDVVTVVAASNNTTEDVIVQKKSIKTYPFAFEHHSPSDTWGDHCHNGGRVNYVNPYEGKKCDRSQMLVSGAINQINDGAINYLHYFSLQDDYVIDEQGGGAISAIIVRDDGQIMVVCEYTTYSIRSNDDRAVVTNDGYVSLPTNKRYSRPERNPSFNFGCQLSDLNTIRRNDSIVFFLDSHKGAFVMHDFNNAIDVSVGIKSWLIPSIKEVILKQNAKYWHTCFDYRLNKIFLTKFDNSTGQYVNKEIENRIDLSETFAYSYESKQWSQSHFTPEYFGNMYSDKKDTQFFSFKNALPYAHHNAVNPGSVYLNYFGVQCFPVIGVVTNEGQVTEKGFISNEVHCREILFILERVETSMGQKSRVYEGGWEKGAGKSYAAYFCDTANADLSNPDVDLLSNGDSLTGKWLKGLYVPNPDYKGEYFVITAIISFYFNRD